LVGWFLLRLLNGLAGAMSLIPIETLVNRTAPRGQRSRNFGYYAFTMALGIALGTLVGTQIYPFAPRWAFVIGGCGVLPGTAALAWLTWPELSAEPRHQRITLALGRNLLSFGSAWSQGFLEGSMMALLPVYLLAIGLSEAPAGWLMSGIIIGVIVFQVPVAWLADRFGRTAVLLSCHAVVMGVLALSYFGLSLSALAVCLFLAGACSSAFYPLGLAILGERVPGAGLAKANAWFLGINCLGSLVGPVAAGAAMDQFGKQALFAAALASVVLVLPSWATLHFWAMAWRRISRRVPSEVDSVEMRQAG
jgi:MFS family permease